MAEEELRESAARLGLPRNQGELLAGVSGESTPPSSHLTVTKSSPLEAILSLVTVPASSNAFLT